MKKFITILPVVVLFFMVTGCNHTNSKVGPWDLEVLSRVPDYEKTDTASQTGLTGILYESVPYMGNPVQVFAYYGTPDGPVPDDGWPAVVCVHGGGGTAFSEWVKLWNDHGFAAIGMDLEGHFPIRKNKEGRARVSTPYPGPSRVGVFGDFDLPVEDQWYFHAVSQAIIAHSLISSFPEVNPEKTGVTGISWGGTLTSTIMGVDDRFQFAIPVYGCGYLPDSDGHQGDAIKPGEHTRIVYTYFDGSAYFSNVNIPTLWVNGTNDNHFSMPATQQSSRSVNVKPMLRFELRMRHGHRPGWLPEEIYAFASSIVKGEDALIDFGVPVITDSIATVSFSTSYPSVRAELLYTLDTGIWNKRHWQALPASVDGSEIRAKIPDESVAIYFSATDERDLMTSSEYILTK